MKPKTHKEPETSNLNQETSPQIKELYELVEIMRAVDLNDPEAEINATTISDGKGGRILL